jgi:hypothetical protein
MRDRARFQTRGRTALLGALVLVVLTQVAAGLFLDRYGLSVRFPSAARVLGRVTREPQPDIIILGTSRFEGIPSAEVANVLCQAGPRDRRPVIYNLSVPAGDPIAQEFILNHLLETGIRPRMVVAEVGPDFLRQRNELFSMHHHRQMVWSDVPTCVHDVARVHHLPDLIASRCVPLYVHRRGLREQSLNALDHLDSPLAAFLQVKGGSEEVEARPEINSVMNLVPPDVSPLTADQEQQFAEMSRSGDRSFRDYQITGSTLAALERMLTRCRKEGIEVLLVAGPMLSYWRCHYTSEIEGAYQQCIDRLVRTYGCSYADYRERLPDRYFKDCMHPNEAGMLYFTRLLAQESLARYWKHPIPADVMASNHGNKEKTNPY